MPINTYTHRSLSRSFKTAAVVALVASVATVNAGVLDGICKPDTRVVSWTMEEHLGTTRASSFINIYKEPDERDSHDPSFTVKMQVKIRSCPFSSEREYETWVSRRTRESGGSEWVPLFGSIEPPSQGQYWLVGKKLPPNTDFYSYVVTNKPERRVVRIKYPDDITKAVEAGTIGGIRLIDHVAKWAHIPKGSRVKLPDGQSATVTIDLAGLDISLTLKRQGQPDEYPDDFYLADSNLDLLSERLTCDRCKNLSPGETRLVTLANGRIALAEHRNAPPRFLVNIRSGLKIPLPPLDR